MSDCVKRDEHCWHEVPIFYLGSDEPYEAVCCHCGARHTAVEKPEIPLGHGQYFPRPVVEVLSMFSSRALWSPSGTFDPEAYNARLAELRAEAERGQAGITEALATFQKTMEAMPPDETAHPGPSEGAEPR